MKVSKVNLYVLEYQGIIANGLMIIAEESVEGLIKNFKDYLRSFFANQKTYYQKCEWKENDDGEGYTWDSIFDEEEFNANFDEDFKLVAKKYATIPHDEQLDNVWSIESEFELRFRMNLGVCNFAFRRQSL